MKIRVLIILAVSVLMLQCLCSTDLLAQQNNFIVGNFTGKGMDTLFLKQTCVVPEDMEDGDGRRSYYDAVSHNKSIPSLQIPGVWPYFVREGDLNGDGTDEFGIVFTWWTSNWSAYYVYTLKDGQWRLLISPVDIYLPDSEEDAESIVTSINSSQKVKITHTIMDDEGEFVKKTEIVPITFE